MKGKVDRPQNKNLKPFDELTPEEAHAIRSAGGKASQAARKRRTEQAYLLGKYAGLAIVDKRTIAKFEKMGFENDEMTRALEIAHAIMTGAKKGNPRMIEIYLSLTGELGNVSPTKDNNIIEALVESTGEDISTDEIPEIQQEAESDPDMVEPPEV